MGFMLYYIGGPLADKKEESRSAPQTIWLDEEQAGGTPGVYTLDRIAGAKAFLIWKPKQPIKETVP